MNKSLRALRPESSRKRFYGFQLVGRVGSVTSQKKSRRFRRLLKLITGRRQTEWTGATRCPNEDGFSHKRESLINRKRTVFFRFCLPCRPLAEWMMAQFASEWPKKENGLSAGSALRPSCLSPLHGSRRSAAAPVVRRSHPAFWRCSLLTDGPAFYLCPEKRPQRRGYGALGPQETSQAAANVPSPTEHIERNPAVQF
jgi:hypothetical protein